MTQSVHDGDLRVNGTLTCKTLVVPAGTVTNAGILQGAGIEATKVVHQFPLVVELFGPATTVAAVSRVIHIARGIGQIVSMQAIVQTKATGNDRTVAVDLKKGDDSTPYATVLSATADFDDGSTNRQPVDGTISDDDYVAGDSLELVVAVAGVAGAQAVGLTVVVWLRENPD